MTLPETTTERRYTYADYLTWDDERRVELHEGEVVAMSPAPTWRHQLVVTALGVLGAPCGRVGVEATTSRGSSVRRSAPRPT